MAATQENSSSSFVCWENLTTKAECIGNDGTVLKECTVKAISQCNNSESKTSLAVCITELTDQYGKRQKPEIAAEQLNICMSKKGWNSLVLQL